MVYGYGVSIGEEVPENKEHSENTRNTGLETN